MSLNNEANSLAANSKYGAVLEKLFSHVKPPKYYQNGTNAYLDSVLAQITSNLQLHDEVISKANKIADNDALLDKEENSAYDSLAHWALMNQDD